MAIKIKTRDGYLGTLEALVKAKDEDNSFVVIAVEGNEVRGYKVSEGDLIFTGKALPASVSKTCDPLSDKTELINEVIAEIRDIKK